MRSAAQEDNRWFTASDRAIADDLLNDVTIVRDTPPPSEATPPYDLDIEIVVEDLPPHVDPGCRERQATIRDALRVLERDLQMPRDMVNGIEWSIRREVADRIRRGRKG